VERKRNELHEYITVPEDLSTKERDQFVNKFLNENGTERYKRLCWEAENLSLNYVEAESYMQKIMSQ
jgi:hypothetical protein